MKPAAERAIDAAEKRHIEDVCKIVQQWPEYRAQFAHQLLGGAIAVCDSFGVDVEGFIAELRRREPMPAVLVPPRRSTS